MGNFLRPFNMVFLAPFFDGFISRLPDGLAILLEAQKVNAVILVQLGEHVDGAASEKDGSLLNE